MTSRIRTTDDIKQLGTIMSVWAHPDDESYSCAGIMCTALGNGQKVVCVTATKGEAGVQDAKRWPPERLGEIRAGEMKAALAVLGITDHHWLGYHDGDCANVSKQVAVAQLKSLIEQYNPDTILTFGPEGMTGHPDHQSISAWVSEAAGPDITVYHAVQLKTAYERMRQADERFNIFFNIDKPPLVEATECDILFELPQDCITKKFAGLKEMPSQTEAMFNHFGKEFICQMINTETFVRAKA